MNVLVLHSELGVLRGGGENFTRNLFTAFNGRGHQVTAAFVADRRGRYPIPLPPVIEPLPIRGWWSRNLGAVWLSRIGRSIPFKSRLRTSWDRFQGAVSSRVIGWHSQRFQRRVEEELTDRWNDFDAVYVHGDTMLASKVARYRPTILRLPGPVSAELSPFLRKIQAVCANGDALKRIANFLGEAAIELPVGLDGRLFKPGPNTIRSILGWSERERVVGYVGRLTQIKGVDLLAAAFLELCRTNLDARLLIIGSGEAEGSIRSILAKEIGSGIAHIERDVDHEQLPEWYRAMNLFVMPSRYENCSNAVLEAMACGVPVLASDIGGNSILAEQQIGWLFESNSVFSLAECLRDLLANDSGMKARCENGRAQMEKRYTWAASAARLESILNRI